MIITILLQLINKNEYNNIKNNNDYTNNNIINTVNIIWVNDSDNLINKKQKEKSLSKSTIK